MLKYSRLRIIYVLIKKAVTILQLLLEVDNMTVGSRQINYPCIVDMLSQLELKVNDYFAHSGAVKKGE